MAVVTTIPNTISIQITSPRLSNIRAEITIIPNAISISVILIGVSDPWTVVISITDPILVAVYTASTYRALQDQERIGLTRILVPDSMPTPVKLPISLLLTEESVCIVVVPASWFVGICIITSDPRSKARHPRIKGRISVRETRATGCRHTHLFDPQVSRRRSDPRIFYKREGFGRRPEIVVISLSPAGSSSFDCLVVIALVNPAQISLHTGIVEISTSDDLTPKTRGCLLIAAAISRMIAMSTISINMGLIGSHRITRRQIQLSHPFCISESGIV